MSLHDIEALLFECGVELSYKTIRRWYEWNEWPPPTGEGLQDAVRHLEASGTEVPKPEDHNDLSRRTGAAIAAAAAFLVRRPAPGIAATALLAGASFIHAYKRRSIWVIRLSSVFNPFHCS